MQEYHTVTFRQDGNMEDYLMWHSHYPNRIYHHDITEPGGRKHIEHQWANVHCVDHLDLARIYAQSWFEEREVSS